MHLQIFLQLLLLNSSFIMISADVTWNDECPPIVSYRLYTEKEISESNQIILKHKKITPESAVNLYFNESAQVKVIFHGFLSDPDDWSIFDLISAYLDLGHLVIAANYGGFTSYPKLFQNKNKLGRCSAALIRAIVDQNSHIQPQHIHIIGFSIGAQITAQVSNNLGERYKVSRITGLDPTRWFFIKHVIKKKNILNKNHADFVDIIHTDVVVYGSSRKMGHYDFFVNGGSNQPFRDGDNDHVMSMKYFAETAAKKLEYSVHRLSCSIWKWRWGLCKEGAELNGIEFGEYATKPLQNDEGSYMVFTKTASTKSLERLDRVNLSPTL